MTFIHITILSLLLSTTLCQRLRFYGASQGGGITNWKPSKFVTTPIFTVCPRTLPSPFTLVCIPSRPAVFAEFFIDGVQERTERVVPYTIAGDYAGKAQPWRPPSSVVVTCRLSNGDRVSATINFVCDGAPVTRPPTTPPTNPPPPPSFQLSSGSAAGNCVRIPALGYTSLFKDRREPSGWEVRGDALFYRPFDGNTGITSAGRVFATYKFRAPANGRFGFTLDMETNGGVDHNDVWVLFEPNGFILTKGGSTRSSSGWTKAYHNSNGRNTQVWSVDFNRHSFATKDSLVKGREYTVKVGGRSTKTGYYSIIMFPCSGSLCDGTNLSNGYWKTTRDRCARA